MSKPIPDCINEAGGNLLGPTTKGIGKTLSEIWYLVLGGRVGFATDKRRIQYQVALDKFAEGIKAKIEVIPEENLIEANTQLIMNTMSDASSCVEEDDLRIMFEKLIAASVNRDLVNRVHPSFSSIIRSMTPNDADNLILFKSSPKKPIANIVMANAGANLSLLNHVFLSNPKNQDIAIQATSITFLESANLLKTSFTSWLLNNVSYEPFESLILVKALRSALNNSPIEDDMLMLILDALASRTALAPPEFENAPPAIKPVIRRLITEQIRKLMSGYTKIDVERGIVELTALGKVFLDVCI